MPELADHARHSPYSDPGRHAAAVAAVPPSTPELHAAARAVIVHYRGQASELVDGQVEGIGLRWLDAILDAATTRSPGDLAHPRPVPEQVAGCCRDHTLFCVGVLRQHGIPARSRVGFASYFEDGFQHDHVVAEHWDGTRWVRHDPEAPARDGLDREDLPTGLGAPFETAAEVWLAHRRDGLDVSAYGVDRSMPELCGREFVRGYVFMELAHRQREEVLLWDVWGTELPPSDGEPAPTEAERDALADEMADLLVRADAGDAAAEAELDRRYASDPRLPPHAVVTMSPTGKVGDVDLATRTTTWRG
jgi:hypothetical protein